MAGLLYLLLHIAWVSKVLVVSWETESLFGIVLSWEDINRCVYHYIQIEISRYADAVNTEMCSTNDKIYQMKRAFIVGRVESYIAIMVH